MSQEIPDFIIIGAMKAGTTSLYRYLQSHPGVFMSEEGAKLALPRIGDVLAADRQLLLSQVDLDLSKWMQLDELSPA